jgi:hypothetical protein
MKVKKVKVMPDWFPLDVYGRTLKPEDWLTEIYIRLGIKSAFDNGLSAEEAKEVFQRVFIENTRGGDASFLEENPRWPVSPMNISEVFYLSALWKDDKHLELRKRAEKLANDFSNGQSPCFDAGDGNNSEGALRQLNGGNDEAYSQLEALSWRLPVSVDIMLDDEVLVEAFKSFLSVFRSQEKNLKAKPFKQDDYDDWHKFQILAAFDLNLWELITGTRCTQPVIGKSLWPADSIGEEEYFDPTERYRKVTKPLVEKIFTVDNVERLQRQLSLERLIGTI